MENLDKEKEIWRPIEGYPDYKVSSFGRIRNSNSGLNIKGHLTDDGYYQISIKKKGFRIHRLVAKAFPEICGEWFEGCHVHHLDKNPNNSHATNLVVCTKEEHYTYHHDDRVEAMKKRSGINHPNYGKHPSEETRKKMSIGMKGLMSGEKHPNYGKHPSEESRKKMSESRTGLKQSAETIQKRVEKLKGRKCSLETRMKIGKANKGKFNKPIYQYTLDNEFVKEWESTLELKNILDYDNGTISKCCNGKRKTAYGYKWKFKSDVENNK